ncbi:MAG: hypothetical protein GXP38_13210 [Chloroflexi bacterium]|nr:hypothetical protein [Chloroflexota bacterium]
MLLDRVKTTPIDSQQAAETGYEIIKKAGSSVHHHRQDLLETIGQRFDERTRSFVDYWFSPDAQVELMALLQEIEKVEDTDIRSFLILAFSAIIITKSGGVSLARDLAHTRPHKVNDKSYRSPIQEFRKRLQRNLTSLAAMPSQGNQVALLFGNAQNLPLRSNFVDLIVTSPPYAANAIDYMRAHKFSLVWLGYPIAMLSDKRKEYIGGESITGFQFEALPASVEKIVAQVAALDAKKSQVLLRYYSEMTRTLQEMWRVLKPGKGAVVVVGTSTMRGIDTRTQDCLAAIGQSLGFDVVGIGVRKLDRNRRMMPARQHTTASQIEQRMHEEYVIGYYKPNK